MSDYLFFSKIWLDRVDLLCYNCKSQKVLHADFIKLDYFKYDSRYIFSNQEFVNEFVMLINSFEKKTGKIITDIYLIFEDSFITSKSLNVFIENEDETRVSQTDFVKLEKKAVNHFKFGLKDDSKIIAVYPIESTIDDIKVNFGKKSRGKKLKGTFFILSMLDVVLNKIDFFFSKIKIHIQDIFSSELLYSFYINSYLNDEKESFFSNCLFFKIKANETVFYLSDEKGNIYNKHIIKRGIMDIVKSISKELHILNEEFIMKSCILLDKINDVNESDAISMNLDGFEHSVKTAELAEVFYKNILEIIISLDSFCKQNELHFENVLLHSFDFNQGILERIAKDIFKKPIKIKDISLSYKKNIINNERLNSTLLNQPHYDDLIIAIDFFKKIINRNLIKSDTIFSSKIACFLKSIFY